MDFIAIDFETANSNLAYPCSLGITVVNDNEITDNLSFLINPEGEFSPYNIKIHGITPRTVKDSPCFPEVWQKTSYLFQSYPAVAHNASFDSTVLKRAAARYNIELPQITYYCTMRLSQQNYPNSPGYTLDKLCSYLNIDLMHHHCCDDDSCAAANIMIQILKNENASIFTYNNSLQTDTTSHTSQNKKYDALFKEPNYASAHVDFDSVDRFSFKNDQFCITGDIENYDRSTIKEVISKLGGKYSDSISKNTNYLIVGMEDKNVIVDPRNVKSTKIIKAEHLRDCGAKIKIVSSEQFLEALSEVSL